MGVDCSRELVQSKRARSAILGSHRDELGVTRPGEIHEHFTVSPKKQTVSASKFRFRFGQYATFGEHIGELVLDFVFGQNEDKNCSEA